VIETHVATQTYLPAINMRREAHVLCTCSGDPLGEGFALNSFLYMCYWAAGLVEIFAFIMYSCAAISIGPMYRSNLVTSMLSAGEWKHWSPMVARQWLSEICAKCTLVRFAHQPSSGVMSTPAAPKCD
jgi:hypothetical protein